MKKSFKAGVFLAAMLLAHSMQVAYAAGDVVGYSAKALLPENQISQSKTYFDLHMQPGQQQTIEVEVFNSASKEIEILAKLNTASTNKNGVIDYMHPVTPDESMKYIFVEIAKLRQDSIKIAPHSAGKLQIDIKMPDTSYDGIVLGGLMLSEKTSDKKSESEQGIMLQNEYAYVIGICLSESSVRVEPQLNLRYIKPQLVNGYTAVAANLQNSAAIDIQGLKISAQVYQFGRDIAKYSVRSENVCMAPNSNFDFAIDLNHHKIQPGKYRLHLVADTGAKQWEWDEVFVIEPNEAKDLNDEAVITQPEENAVFHRLLLWVILILPICTLTIGFYMGKRRNKLK